MQLVKRIQLLYNFGRPHTIIGSFVSITTLVLLVQQNPLVTFNGYMYIMLLVAALACNVFITGYNQITDVDIDRVNKPYLPIVNGSLTMQQAKNIVWVSGGICIVTSLILSWLLTIIMVVIMGIGYAYSAPVIRFKKHHLPAALCIVMVRGVIVNLGIGTWLCFYLYGGAQILPVLYPLTVFIVAFSIAIAWLKDLHDVEGDALHNIRTFAILYTAKWAFWLSAIIVGAGYLFSIFFIHENNSIKNSSLLVTGHIILGVFFIIHTATSSYSSRAAIHKFYMQFWIFFFVQYILYAVSAVI
jgi:homogentisate phytyltransferase / homogentisate geranylgeranyltransferase